MITLDQHLAEVERLHAFARALAQRLFLAAEVLSIRAERKKAGADTPAVVWVDGGLDDTTGIGR